MRFSPGTRRRAVPLLLLALPALFVSSWLAFALVAAGYATVAFFRDPERTLPESGVVSPADGRVSVVREEGDRLRVGVFMNVTDVHVNRAPLSGAVERVEHRAGAHRPAFSKESERNERVDLSFDGFEVSLVAGAFARRIFPYLEAGDRVERGDRVGHVAFGSRADVLLPPEYGRGDLLVEAGDRVRAAETVLARRASD